MHSLFLLFFSLVLSVAISQLLRIYFYQQARRTLRQAGSNAIASPMLRQLGGWGLVCAAALIWMGGSPLSALCVLIGGPLLVRFISLVRAQSARARLEDSGLAYLHALRGLVHSGLGLSAAFFRLARAQRSPFASAMAKSLDAFDDGKTLAACLDHLQRRVRSPLMGATLRNLQSAYRQGLPVAILLDQMVPALEAERDCARRAADVRRSAWTQAGVAFCVPWVLVAVSVACRPEGGVVWLAEPWGLTLVGCALLMEGVGVWLIGHCSRFF